MAAAAMSSASVAVGANERMDEVFVTSCVRVQQWRLDKVAAQKADAQRALHELQRDKATVDSLRDTLAVTEELAAGATDLQASSARVAQIVRESAEAAEARAEATRQLRERLQREREANAEALAAAEATLAKKQQGSESMHADIENLFALFNKHLGLKVSRAAPSVVCVALSLVDPLDPEREFSFKLGLADPVTYCVSDCKPALPQQLVSTLVARLNDAPAEPCALPAFVCSMRRAFRRALAKAGVAGGA